MQLDSTGLESLVIRDKISCRFVGDPYKRGGEIGVPLLKSLYFTASGLSSVKMVADCTDVLFNITSTGDELLTNVNVNDLG